MSEAKNKVRAIEPENKTRALSPENRVRVAPEPEPEED